MRGKRVRSAGFDENTRHGMLFFGFSAGLPFLLIVGTLSFWLSEAVVSRTTIGFCQRSSALGTRVKLTWAPLVDRLPLPWLRARWAGAAVGCCWRRSR